MEPRTLNVELATKLPTFGFLCLRGDRSYPRVALRKKLQISSEDVLTQ